MPDIVEIITSNPVIEIIGASSVVEIVEVGPAGPPIADGTYGEILVTNSGSKFWPGWEYEDRAALALATVPSIITRIYVRYYSAATQLGGAHYKRVASQPAHDLWVQDAGGKYFEIDETDIDIRQAGALVDGSTDDITAILNAIDYVKTKNGGRVLFPPGISCVTQTILVDGSHVILEGTGKAGYRASHLTIPASASSTIKWTGPEGGTIVKFDSPAGGARRNGGGMRNISIDGNAFSAAIGIELRSWIRGLWQNVNVERCSTDHWLMGITDNELSETPIDFRDNRFNQCSASTRGGSGTYLTSTAKGFRLTGAAGANTCFNVFDQCITLLSKGVSYYLENCDYNIFRGCTGGAQRDATVYTYELCSGDQDSAGNGIASRYNVIQDCQSSIRVRAAQSGGASSSGNFIQVNRGNGVGLPVFEAAAGGSSEPTATVIDMDGGLYFGGKLVLNRRLDTWETPTGPGSRETFDSESVTLPQLAARVRSLIVDLSQLRTDSHGMIGLTANGATADADMVAGEEFDVFAASFIDDTVRIRDTATPANNYTGTVAAKMTVTGTLASGATGAYFDISNYAVIELTDIPWSNTGGSLMIEYSDDEFATTTNYTLAHIDNGSNGMRFIVRSASSPTPRPIFIGVAGAVTQWSISPSSWANNVNGEVRRIAMSWSGNDIAVSVDGSAVAADTSGTLPTPTTLRLGVTFAPDLPADCRIRRVFYTPRVLSDKELIQMSGEI